MRAEIDLTEDDTSEPPGDGSFAHEPTISDDFGEMLLHLGAIDIRMTYSQLNALTDILVTWRNA